MYRIVKKTIWKIVFNVYFVLMLVLFYFIVFKVDLFDFEIKLIVCLVAYWYHPLSFLYNHFIAEK